MYTLTCIALNSRPSVNLQLINLDNGVSLENYPSSTVYNVTRISACDNSGFCITSSLSVTINLNNDSLISWATLACTATNSTPLYDIFVQTQRIVQVTAS